MTPSKRSSRTTALSRAGALSIAALSPLFCAHMCGRSDRDPVDAVLSQKVWTVNDRAQVHVRVPTLDQGAPSLRVQVQ